MIGGDADRDTAADPIVEELDALYAERFPDTVGARRRGVWREIAAFLQRWVPRGGRVLDLACDRGDFINNIVAADRWATDIRDVSSSLDPRVRFVQADGLVIDSAVPNGTFDVVFVSNYLEHLPSHQAVLVQLRAVRAVLKPGGRVVILQPNIRLIGGAYWDFLDHRTPLTDRSLEEAASIAGLVTEHVIRRFLPYTTRSRLPQHRWLVRAYLRFRPAWLLLGKQTLYVAQRPMSG